MEPYQMGTLEWFMKHHVTLQQGACMRLFIPVCQTAMRELRRQYPSASRRHQFD